MYKPRHLLRIATSGWADLAPALQRAFNRRDDDDRLDRVFGPRPKLAIAGLVAAGLVVGGLLDRIWGGWPLLQFVSFPAVVIATAYALLFRRYLFGSDEAREEDFPWLAASLVPAAAALVFVHFTMDFFGGLQFVPGAPEWTGMAAVLAIAADALAVGAALAIAVAALCFRSDWKRAVRDLAVQLLVFKLTVFVMVLLLVEIGIVGPVLGAIARGLFGIPIPPWLGDLVDQLAYAVLMSVLYLALIGAVWTVCRQRFGRLLATGDADIVAAVRHLAETPEQRARRMTRARRRARKQAS